MTATSVSLLECLHDADDTAWAKTGRTLHASHPPLAGPCRRQDERRRRPGARRPCCRCAPVPGIQAQSARRCFSPGCGRSPSIVHATSGKLIDCGRRLRAVPTSAAIWRNSKTMRTRWLKHGTASTTCTSPDNFWNYCGRSSKQNRGTCSSASCSTASRRPKWPRNSERPQTRSLLPNREFSRSRQEAGGLID